MALKSTETRSSGFGERFDRKTLRSINADGSFNVVKKGVKHRTLYQHLLSYKWPKFFLVIVLFFAGVNLLFAFGYYQLGENGLFGIPDTTGWNHFWYCYFFSVQTMTTVGYGSVHPVGIGANVLASIEAFLGLMIFSLMTGLLFGRFSRPKAEVRFSKNILFVPREDGGHDVHFQVANARTSQLLEASIQVILRVSDMKTNTRKFYNLPLEISNIVFFPLNWRVVHSIDESSPMHQVTADNCNSLEYEVMILFAAFDETFQQRVYTRHSYVAEDFVWNARFEKSYSAVDSGMVHMDLDDLDKFNRVD